MLSAPAATAKGTTGVFGTRIRFDTPVAPGRVEQECRPDLAAAGLVYIETAKSTGSGRSTSYLRRIDHRLLMEAHCPRQQGRRYRRRRLRAIRAGPAHHHRNTLYIRRWHLETAAVSVNVTGKYKLNPARATCCTAPDQNSIGLAATHGCVRLRDEDIGGCMRKRAGRTRVYIY